MDLSRIKHISGHDIKFIDIGDWGISFELLYLLQDRWGKLDVDWFASSYNAKLPVFFSRFWNEGSTGMDAFTENWGEVFGLFVPSVILVPRVLKQIQEQRTRGVLVILFWPSGVLASFMHGPEGIYQANYRLDGSVHFKRFLYALNVWSGVFWYRRPLFSLKVNYPDLLTSLVSELNSN